MTDRCAPPDGSPSGYYWIIADGQTTIGHWAGSMWFSAYGNVSEKTATRRGWVYLRPARPDDAEARERLHRWVMAMMPTLNAMAAEDMAMDGCRDAIDIVSEIAADLKLPDGWNDETLMEALRNAR